MLRELQRRLLDAYERAPRPRAPIRLRLVRDERDPDGTRLEINYVPGKGLLAPGTQIGGGYADGTQNG